MRISNKPEQGIDRWGLYDMLIYSQVMKITVGGEVR